MTKWKHLQLTDKGDTVTDIIDPEAHEIIKVLEEELKTKEEDISKRDTDLKEIESTIEKLEVYITLLKEDMGIENAKSNILSEELNKSLVNSNHIKKELEELRGINQSLGKQFTPLASARNNAVQSERQALLQLEKYTNLLNNARKQGWSKDELRKLKTLLGE